MIAIYTALHFAAAWLAIGLGLFMVSGSAGALRATALQLSAGSRGAARMASALYVLPLFLGVGLVIYGVLEVVRVVPW